MNTTVAKNFRTHWPKKEEIKRKWYLADAKDQTLGRLSSQIATILMGKQKPLFTPSVDCGDCVVAINADQVRLTGKKLDQKVAFHHTGYPGGARITPYRRLFQEKPERVLYLAVKRMLSKNKLASRQILRLKIYRGSSHPHTAQNPEKIL